MINTLSFVGNENKWKEQRTNHLFTVFLPMGITYVWNGNHSVNSGIIKSEGYLEISPDKEDVCIYDISDLYEEIYFDGIYYKEKDTEKIRIPTSFEFGCLFEIGRIIQKYNLSFFTFIKE